MKIFSSRWCWQVLPLESVRLSRTTSLEATAENAHLGLEAEHRNHDGAQGQLSEVPRLRPRLGFDSAGEGQVEAPSLSTECRRQGLPEKKNGSGVSLQGLKAWPRCSVSALPAVL